MDSKDNLSEEELKIVDAIIEEETKKQEVKKEGVQTKTNETKETQEEVKASEKTPNGFIEFYKRYTFLISATITAVAIAVTYLLGESGYSLFREVNLLIYVIVAFGFFVSVFRLILKIPNTIIRIILGFLHFGFWIVVSIIVYIIMALLFCSYGNLTHYHEKTYVKEYGFFSSSNYHVVVNPLMYEREFVNQELKDEINTYEN